MSTKVSFTIRRPTPESRATSTGPDSDDTRFKLPALPPHLIQDNYTSNNRPGSPLVKPPPKRSTPDNADSSDEDDDQPTDELVTGFDQFGVQRYVPALLLSARQGRSSLQFLFLSLTSVLLLNWSHKARSSYPH